MHSDMRTICRIRQPLCSPLFLLIKELTVIIKWRVSVQNRRERVRFRPPGNFPAAPSSIGGGGRALSRIL